MYVCVCIYNYVCIVFDSHSFYICSFGVSKLMFCFVLFLQQDFSAVCFNLLASSDGITIGNHMSKVEQLHSLLQRLWINYISSSLHSPVDTMYVYTCMCDRMFSTYIYNRTAFGRVDIVPMLVYQDQWLYLSSMFWFCPPLSVKLICTQQNVIPAYIRTYTYVSSY